jgi:hypothetical protein
MITRLTLVLFGLWFVLTALLFGPEWAANKRCEQEHKHQAVSYEPAGLQDGVTAEFHPCSLNREQPLWKELLWLSNFCLFVAWPIALTQDLCRWFRRIRTASLHSTP